MNDVVAILSEQTEQFILYMVKWHSKLNERLIPFVNKAYELYFGCKSGDNDKTWSLEIFFNIFLNNSNRVLTRLWSLECQWFGKNFRIILMIATFALQIFWGFLVKENIKWIIMLSPQPSSFQGVFKLLFSRTIYEFKAGDCQ